MNDAGTERALLQQLFLNAQKKVRCFVPQMPTENLSTLKYKLYEHFLEAFWHNRL